MPLFGFKYDDDFIYGALRSLSYILRAIVSRERRGTPDAVQDICLWILEDASLKVKDLNGLSRRRSLWDGGRNEEKTGVSEGTWGERNMCLTRRMIKTIRLRRCLNELNSFAHFTNFWGMYIFSRECIAFWKLLCLLVCFVGPRTWRLRFGSYFSLNPAQWRLQHTFFSCARNI